MTTLNAGDDAEKLDHWVAGENVKWYNYFGKQLGILLKKKKQKPKYTLQYNPAITLPGIYPRDIKKNLCLHKHLNMNVYSFKVEVAQISING